MRNIRLVTWMLLITLAAACAPVRVIEFVNEDMDFSDYHSYRLINFQTDNKSYSDEGTAFFTSMESEIHRNMVLKGFEEQRKSPDLIVRYELMSTTTADTPNINYYDPYYYYSPPPRTTYQTEGILLIEFRDRQKKKLVWQASLDLKYSKKMTPDMVLKKTIDRIFETYPYLAGSKERIVREK
ncbi:DUF4136 domain-containing protein [Reichenbachiella agarivorans]|uniref:DUF4136 domain-containing protein n=1 Tax=Reichenbachiella agarivorans TaxID=2979464 RepID=A0ABY6CM64_9BACT|nr:DUF4136 domain-containing protein [Reichenbachiella agarivorans]UXP31612.1 DUF4136 domain-containing protein [Reichenbachiella agarivorans]